MEVDIQDIPVIYVVSSNGPTGSVEAFHKLEDALEWQLKGRKFYGTMLRDEYRACVEVTDSDDLNKLNLPTWTIPGGTYYKHKMKDWMSHIPEIASICDTIISKIDYDPKRPIIEFYRSQKELLLFVPVK